eukprot:1148278-Pelagomonas_calceolata.AAC.3
MAELLLGASGINHTIITNIVAHHQIGNGSIEPGFTLLLPARHPELHHVHAETHRASALNRRVLTCTGVSSETHQAWQLSKVKLPSTKLGTTRQALSLSLSLSLSLIISLFHIDMAICRGVNYSKQWKSSHNLRTVYASAAAKCVCE